MEEFKLWKVFVSLGIPGLALGVFYMLFRQFHWQFPRVPRSWVGPIIVLFMLLTSGLVYRALTLWSPNIHNHPPSKDSISFALPEDTTLREAIEFLVQKRQASFRFDPTCTDELLSRRLKGGTELMAENVEGIIMNLGHHLIDTSQTVQLHVEFKREEGHYEIRCST